MKRIFFCCVLFLLLNNAMAQLRQNLVYADKQGVLRWTKDNKEAAFFGVNYTVPFAYGYRSLKALNIDIEKAIDADVHHMWRMGLDAFRVHVWDVEISDSTGKLLENEHLRLFDYLIKKLKEKNIKIFITPIAFWGNGYPEQDENTPGFSTVYGKGPSVVLEVAIRAQENYLEQFFKHINPYTKLSYTDDPDVIATEINNEPHHSGPKEKATEYVNRMAAAIKKAGWTKPIFYNISESPWYSDAVVKASVDGHSFQWYPSGLVAGREQKGNFLPHVDNYYIPFNDTVPGFKKRVKMVYEFDAADIMLPIMYPAMARSYRTAGFQWATQFAYDPMHTAYGNTEYQTHYLNLVYTPAKAISMLIASKVFHSVPRHKSYGAYPADTVFDAFALHYRSQTAVMNTDTAFYYSNSTPTHPRVYSSLKHIAGVGNSPMVYYEGTGAYFLDKLEDGIWRLEVMPDAIAVKDPFERASPRKEVTRIQWRTNKMEIYIPELSGDKIITGLNKGNDHKGISTTSSIFVSPGVYLISKDTRGLQKYLSYAEFHAPPPAAGDPVVGHQPLQEVTAGNSFAILAKIAGIDTSVRVSAELRNSSNKWETVPMKRLSGYNYRADVPAVMVVPGVINYRIMVWHAENAAFTFPGGTKGYPYAWDEYRNESWETFVAAPDSPLELFNATADRNKLIIYTPGWRTNAVEHITTEKPKVLAVRTTMNKPAPNQFMGWQFYFADKLQGRISELNEHKTLVVRARSEQQLTLRCAIITHEANAYSISIPLTREWKDHEIPLTSLKEDSFYLLPRPYPGFLPLKFKSASARPLNLSAAEKLEIIFGEGTASLPGPVSVEVERVWLKRE